MHILACFGTTLGIVGLVWLVCWAVEHYKTYLEWSRNDMDYDTVRESFGGIIACLVGIVIVVALLIFCVDWKQTLSRLPVISFFASLAVMFLQTYKLREAAEFNLPQKSVAVYLLVTISLSIGSIFWADHSSPGCWIILSCIWTGIVLFLLIYYFGRHGEVRYESQIQRDSGSESRRKHIPPTAM